MLRCVALHGQEIAVNSPVPAALALALLYGVLVALVAEAYPRLPERVASHFSLGGEPDGWMSRPSYAASILLGAAMVAIVCAGALYIARYLPVTSVNIPNRAYWLAPERRRETYDKLLAFGLWLDCLDVALFIGLHILTVRANRAVPVRLPAREAGGLMGLFLFGFIGLVGYFCARSWRVEAEG